MAQAVKGKVNDPKVMALSTLRTNLFKTFFLLRDTGAELEISYRRKVYKLAVTATGKKVHAKYQRKHQKPLLLQEGNCGECGKLALNGICIDNCVAIRRT